MQSLKDVLGEGYIKVNCPHPEHEDSDPSYVIYPTGGYCFGCGFRETPEQVMERTGGIFEQSAKRRRRTSADPLVDLDGHIRFWNRTLLEGPRRSRISWLMERGIGQRAIETFKLGHSGDHFTIPVWTYGVLTGFKKRADPKFVDPDSPKYLNQRGGGALFTTYTGRPDLLVITEGELDAITLSQFGYDCATCTTGSDGLAEAIQSLRSISTIPTVLSATDMDDAGDKSYEALKQVRPDTKRLVWSEGNDISEFLCRVDGGSRGEAIRTLIRKAEQNAR